MHLNNSAALQMYAGGDILSGVTKHIYEKDIRDIQSMWNQEIQTISFLLPKDYSFKVVVELLKKYYPHEWRSVELKYEYYRIKDKHIKSKFGKARYNMMPAEKLLQDNLNYRRIMTEKYKEMHSANFCESKCKIAEAELWSKREPKIERINKKIELAKSKTQQVTPEFIDKLIGLYNRKNTNQKDKVYIIYELKKYYNTKVINFFFKLNDTEINRQLREIAFYHLQSFNYHPRLRRQKYMQVHTKNKKRKNYLKNEYANEYYTLPQNPQELEYRIENGREQKIKEYDYFISHSSKDSSAVQRLILHENSLGKYVFCDWINDADYLKRHLVCAATLKVIEMRLEKSKALIFVESNNSAKSVWCKYELNYFNELNRPIYVINKTDIDNGNFTLAHIHKEDFLDSNYKQLALLNTNGKEG